uniref:Uncharacterized protein n=1 Tax=feces metagenome TaxID=1861841 RepID=A0A7M2QNC9_9ZZZZ
MKPMLKTAFFSLVNDLLARGISPELKVSPMTSYGYLKWVEGDSSRVEELYSVRDCSPLTASTFRKRFTAWFAEIMQKYQERLVVNAGIVVGCRVWDHLMYAQRTVKEIRAGGVMVLDNGAERTLEEVKPLLPNEAEKVTTIRNQILETPRSLFTVANDVVRAAMIADAHTEALKINDAYNTLYVYAPGDAARDIWEQMTDIEREVAVEICHANALIEDATFEENLPFLASPEMADIWHKHSDTLKVRILNAAHAAALAMNKRPTTIKEICEAVSKLPPADPNLVDALNAMDSTAAILHMSNTLTRLMQQSEQPGFYAAAYSDIKANYEYVAARCKDRAITIWLRNHLCFGYIGDTYTFVEINQPYRDQLNHILATGWRPEKSATLTLSNIFEMDWWEAKDINITKRETDKVYGTATVTDCEGLYQIAFDWLMDMGEEAERVGLPAIVSITDGKFTLPYEVSLQRDNGTQLDTLEAVQEMDCVLGLSADIFNEVYDKSARADAERLQSSF